MNYAFSGSRQHSEGYRENSGTQFDSLGVDFRYYPAEKVELSLSGGYSDNKARLPGALTASDFAAGAVRTDSNNPDDFADVEDYYVMGGVEFSLGTGSQFEVEGISSKKRLRRVRNIRRRQLYRGNRVGDNSRFAAIHRRAGGHGTQDPYDSRFRLRE